VSKLAPEKESLFERIHDVLDLPDSKKFMKKAGVDEEKLQTDLLFRQNVVNILTEYLKKDNKK
jgi:hypothetical protein